MQDSELRHGTFKPRDLFSNQETNQETLLANLYRGPQSLPQRGF
ncbi:hypothetical protein Pla52o_41080 [Novipirellula galeiformis]|uniref:Uncharacterized protein n=1 Tax=Novipirellula galeiformis TaxID=2528004 RepID=A0A5C6CCD5_9BACT|nr:hypothetical protein Pla52o_41080 [Novipirellula galeiformis]